MKREQLTCSRPECDYPRYARKLCAGHYLQDQPRTPAAPKRGTASTRTGGAVTNGTRAVVLTRCEGRCEACGDLLDGAVHLHHRQRRRLGDHTPANLVALHPGCHVVTPQAVHQRPAWARERGLIVASWDVPFHAPLALPSGRLVLLHLVRPEYLPMPEGPPCAA